MSGFRSPGAFPMTPQTLEASTGPQGRSSSGVKPAKQYGVGRECAGVECLQELSRYNPGVLCSVCDRKARR